MGGGRRPAAPVGPGPGLVHRHAPPEREPVLLWGDVRLGNLVFDEARAVVAVLDWDLASLGPPEMDLGWHFGLDFMMEELFGRRVTGFPSHVETLRSATSAPPDTRCATSPGTRCSPWCAPSPSTAGAGIATSPAVQAQWPRPRHTSTPGVGRPVPPGRSRRADQRPVRIHDRSPGQLLQTGVSVKSGLGVEQREAHHARLGHFVTECVVRLDEAVGDLALARDAAVVLVLGRPAGCARRGR